MRRFSPALVATGVVGLLAVIFLPKAVDLRENAEGGSPPGESTRWSSAKSKRSPQALSSKSANQLTPLQRDRSLITRLTRSTVEELVREFEDRELQVLERWRDKAGAHTVFSVPPMSEELRGQLAESYREVELALATDKGRQELESEFKLRIERLGIGKDEERLVYISIPDAEEEGILMVENFLPPGVELEYTSFRDGSMATLGEARTSVAQVDRGRREDGNSRYAHLVERLSEAGTRTPIGE